MNEMRRIKIYKDVINFPTVKTAGAATIESNQIYDFESTLCSLNLFLRASLADKITDTLTIKLYVSYDGGTTWLLVTSYSDLAAGGAVPIISIKNDIISYAPRIKLVADFDGTAELASGHGCAVDARLIENLPDSQNIIFKQIAPATMGNNETVNGTTFYAHTGYPNIRAIRVASYCADKTKVTDNLTWKVQSSYDGIIWFDATTAQTDILNGSGSSFTEANSITDKLGKYARIVYMTDGTGEIAADHGIQHNIILYY
jgi:hypothetical protein